MKQEPVNINCDLGEGVEREPQLFPYIFSCSIACGGHYGDRHTLLNTLKQAAHHQVKVGAHPSYPDTAHFGRRSLQLSKEAFQESLRIQLRLYFDCLELVGLPNFHIKAHGALYNDLAIKEELSEWYLEVLCEFPPAFLYAPYGSVLARRAQEGGMKVLYEAFLDRNYLADGRLVPRTHPKAMKETPEDVWRQLHDFLEKEGVVALDGRWVHLPANTFCLHGDHPKALEFLKVIDSGLKQRNR